MTSLPHVIRNRQNATLATSMRLPACRDSGGLPDATLVGGRPRRCTEQECKARRLPASRQLTFAKGYRLANMIVATVLARRCAVNGLPVRSLLGPLIRRLSPADSCCCQRTAARRLKARRKCFLCRRTFHGRPLVQQNLYFLFTRDLSCKSWLRVFTNSRTTFSVRSESVLNDLLTVSTRKPS